MTDPYSKHTDTAFYLSSGLHLKILLGNYSEQIEERRSYEIEIRLTPPATKKLAIEDGSVVTLCRYDNVVK